MKLYAKIWTVALLGLLIFSLFAMPVMAQGDVYEDSDTISIEGNEYWAHTINLPDGGGVEYEINGDNSMNIYFLDEVNLQRYQQGQPFQYSDSGSSLNTQSFKAFMTINQSAGGTYYLVVESANYQNVTFTYTLKYGKDLSTNPFDFFGYTLSATCCIIGGLFFLIWIFVLVWVYKDAKRRGKSGIAWVLVVLILGILGLIIWLLVRPPLRQPPQYPPPQYPPPQ